MQRAEKNIEELLENLNRTYHRLRQDSIDEELFDVVSGFEAQGTPMRICGEDSRLPKVNQQPGHVKGLASRGALTD
jgi:hypothetical protein